MRNPILSRAKLAVTVWDPNLIQPLSTSVTVDANGWAYVPVRAVGVGVSPLLVRDVIGDAGVGTVSAILPSVSSSSSVSEGATYDPSSQPKFTFNIGYPSRDPVDVHYSLTGSTATSGDYSGLPTDGIVTIPAGQTVLDVPITAPEINKVSADRSIVVTLAAWPNGTPNFYTPQRAMMVIQSIDTPTVTIKGQSDNAAVTVDPQGDDSLLAEIGMTVKYEGVLKDVKLSWDPSQMVMWPSDHVGDAGKDLASLEQLTPDRYTGLDTYIWPGTSAPSKVWAQAINGSPSVDGTLVQLAADVSEPATAAVRETDASPNKDAHSTNSGLVISLNGAPVGPKFTANKVIVGEQVNLKIDWSGPNPNPLLGANVSYLWKIDGKIADHFYAVVGTINGAVTSDGGAQSVFPFTNQTINFMWYAGAFTGQEEDVTCSVTTPNYSGEAKVGFDVFRPQATITTTARNILINGGFPGPSELTLGQPGPGMNGIEFLGNSTEPQGYTGGSYEWIQTLNRTDWYHSTKNNQYYAYHVKGLDNLYPLPAVNPPPGSQAVIASSDSPNIFNAPNEDEYGMDGMYDTYLMYKPNIPGVASDWVPLRHVKWNVIDGAVGNAGRWVIVPRDNPPPQPTDMDATQYPSWGNMYINSTPANPHQYFITKRDPNW